jgi:hypothetical protein
MNLLFLKRIFLNNKIFFSGCLFYVSLICAAENKIFQLTVDPCGALTASGPNRDVFAQAIQLLVDLQTKNFKAAVEEQEKVDLSIKDLEWMYALYSLLSEQDQKGCNFEVRKYVEDISKKKKIWSEFYPGSLEKAKNSLMEKIKEGLDKGVKYDKLFSNPVTFVPPDMKNTPSMQKDAQIDQLERDNKNLEDRLKVSFVIDKAKVKRLGFLAVFAGIVIWTVRFLYRNKCGRC